jgi:hypothetical protein
LSSDILIGVCFTGGALLLGIVGTQIFTSRKVANNKRNSGRKIDRTKNFF